MAQQLKDSVRVKIIESASNLFFSQGCKRVTMDDVSNSLRMSKRTLYMYFRTKEELLESCLQQVADRRKTFIESTLEQSSSPAFVMLQLFSQFAQNNQELTLMLNDTKRWYPEIYSKFFIINEEKCFSGIHRNLELAQRNGDLRPNVDIEKATAVLLHFITKMTSAPNTTDCLDLISESGYTFVRGLLSIDAIKQYDKQEKKLKDIIK